jgi:hypothetical protein
VSYDPAVPEIYVTLNARLRPLDRGEHFEDPLLELLEQKVPDLEVTGGGTLLGANREPSICDLDLSFSGDAQTTLRLVIETLEKLGAPVGSFARFGGESTKVMFGSTEGIGVYLNGTDLPDEVYQNSDVNELIDRLGESLGDGGRMYSYWEGPTETALYFYGPSADEMKRLMADVLDTHPLAQRCRVAVLTPTR